MDTIDETPETEKRRTTVHNRFHVCCSICGLVTAEQRTSIARAAMLGHLSEHPLTENVETDVWDSMAKNGITVKYRGRIRDGVMSQGTW